MIVLITFRNTELLFAGEKRLNMFCWRVCVELTCRVLGLKSVSHFPEGSVISERSKLLLKDGAIAKAERFIQAIRATMIPNTIFFIITTEK
ncbi:MAG: hypothetical protein WCJ81_04985 [bacterium]